MTGVSKLSNQVFLINFGLAQLFQDPLAHQHIPLMSGLKTVGTIALTSINSHSGQTKSCHDDLESLMYSVVYLCCGYLPWQGIIIKGGPVKQYEAAILKKQTTMAKMLCQGLPLLFVTFTQHIQSLGFDEKPWYNYLCMLLMQCMTPNNIVLGGAAKSRAKRGFLTAGVLLKGRREATAKEETGGENTAG